MNEIPQKQNEVPQLDMLAAQNWLYMSAKRILAIEMMLSVLVPILLAISVSLTPNIRPFTSLLGLLASLLVNLVMAKQQSLRRGQAAQIQDLFDNTLFELPWNKVAADTKPEPEIIIRASQAWKRRYSTQSTPYPELVDWYPPSVGKLPLPLARIVCQRANCRWDGQLRRRYATIVVGVSCIGIVFAILFALSQGAELTSFVVAAFIALPLISFCLRQYQEQTTAGGSSDRLKVLVESLWQSALTMPMNSTQLEQDARTLQHEIYRNRKGNPLIFDWIYKRLRSSFEEEMNISAKQLVDQALQVIKSSNAP